MLVNDEGMTEKEKANSIAKLLSKGGKTKQRAPIKVVVAKGTNKGKGRPAGVKGMSFRLIFVLAFGSLTQPRSL